MPLRLDNARGVAHMPTAEQQQQKNKPVEPRFKIDHAASPMPETRQPERLAPRATSNRNGGRDHLGILGEIKSVHPGEIIGIRRRAATNPEKSIMTAIYPDVATAICEGFSTKQRRSFRRTAQPTALCARGV